MKTGKPRIRLTKAGVQTGAGKTIKHLVAIHRVSSPGQGLFQGCIKNGIFAYIMQLANGAASTAGSILLGPMNTVSTQENGDSEIMVQVSTRSM